ncbi:MAG: nucleotide exchange factor GrpE [Erysipelotrichaceae bacterium]|nr:nucleotide exchange factor GrpE [Erysipelotrichaceae bacterium]
MTKKEKKEKVTEKTPLEEVEKEVKEPAEETNSAEEEIKALQDQLCAVQADLDKTRNDYLKAYADTENMKKRLQAEFEMRNKYRIQSFALEILPVIDNLERALASADKEDSIYKGIEMVYQQLLNALKKEGVEEIESLNKPFDSNFHNALMTEKREGVEPGIVLEVLQKGYKLKDRILRATLVKVSE